MENGEYTNEELKQLGRKLFKGKSEQDIKHIINIIALTAYESMLDCRGDHPSVFDETVVDLTHSIEYYLTDFSQFVSGLIYDVTQC